MAWELRETRRRVAELEEALRRTETALEAITDENTCTNETHNYAVTTLCRARAALSGKAGAK